MIGRDNLGTWPAALEAQYWTAVGIFTGLIVGLVGGLAVGVAIGVLFTLALVAK